MDDDLKRLLDKMRQENAAGFAETRRHLEGLVAETWQHSEALAAETRRHFHVVAERLEKRFDGLAETVQYLDEKLDRAEAGILEEMRRGFSDTQALIKFSYGELNRRLSALE